MPQCYLLSVAAGSSLDQQSNNVTLFNLVEQVNVPPGMDPKPGSRVPLEIHAYLRLGPQEVGMEFEMRYVLVAVASGLETFAEAAKHRAPTSRIRTRSLGLPFPPVLGHYDLFVEFRRAGSEQWTRDALSWPMSFAAPEAKPQVTH